MKLNCTVFVWVLLIFVTVSSCYGQRRKKKRNKAQEISWIEQQYKKVEGLKSAYPDHYVGIGIDSAKSYASAKRNAEFKSLPSLTHQVYITSVKCMQMDEDDVSFKEILFGMVHVVGPEYEVLDSYKKGGWHFVATSVKTDKDQTNANLLNVLQDPLNNPLKGYIDNTLQNELEECLK